MSGPKRECGSCSVCCGVIAVHEIDKGVYEACPHLCEAGCGIYDTRSGSCRTFECQWLRGALEADGVVDIEMRPDACGVIFDYEPDSAFGEMYVAWEVEPGASERGHGRSIIRGLAESFLVMIVPPELDGEAGPGARRFVGPRHRVSNASDVMWSMGSRF